jgi:hypothetical protein
MGPHPADEPIRDAMTVPVPGQRAFAAFVDLARWWPREYPWPPARWRTSASTPTARAVSARAGPLRRHLPLGAGSWLGPTGPPVLAWQIDPDRVPIGPVQGQRGRGPLPPHRRRRHPG